MEEELGRGHRKKIISFKIQRTANVEPSAAKVLPPSLFRDVLPAPEVPVLPQPDSQHKPANPTPSQSGVPSGTTPEPKLEETNPNVFGLYKSYKLYSGDIPYDPDGSSTPSDFRERPDSPAEPSGTSSSSPSLHPFPNLNSFRLGEWFWSDDHEKSQRSFQNLLGIVGSETFNPADIRNVNWNQINQSLAASQFEDDGAGGIGLDDGTSWRSTPVTIQVPISKSSARPGSYPFMVPDFYHRPLVPIIKEKLESATHQERFHTLGSELRWKPGEKKEDVRVFGEMYHSSAFIQAYEELQVRIMPARDV